MRGNQVLSIIVSCTVVLDNAPVEAKIGETARLTGRLRILTPASDPNGV